MVMSAEPARPRSLVFHRTSLCPSGTRSLGGAEIQRPCHGDARATTPLFADINGDPYTHAHLGRILRCALTFLYGASVAALFTFHSYRSGLASALHVRELQPVWVQAYLAPRDGDAQASCKDAPGGAGGLLLHARLRPLNPPADGEAQPDAPAVVLHLRDADQTGGGGGLWHALCRCAALAAGQQPRAPPKCVPRNVASMLSKLQAKPLACGVDLFKQTHKPAVAELVAAYLVR